MKERREKTSGQPGQKRARAGWHLGTGLGKQGDSLVLEKFCGAEGGKIERQDQGEGEELQGQ